MINRLLVDSAWVSGFFEPVPGYLLNVQLKTFIEQVDTVKHYEKKTRFLYVK